MIHKIKALYDAGNGLSKREIAAQLGVSRNSVRKYLSMHVETISKQQRESERIKVLDTYREYIVHLLTSYPKLSAVKVMRKLRTKHSGITVSDRTVRRYVERLKGSINCKQERYYQPVLDMMPGVQCQIDPGELRNVIINGVETTVYFVVFVLSYSRLMYVALSSIAITTSIFIRMHDAAFRYFNGCPEECVYDQTKMVVIHEVYRELTLNQRFYEYATYAGFSIRACEGYDPESKGKVESGVKYTKYNALYGETFDSWSDLESYNLNWLDTVANTRIHGTTGIAPRIYYDTVEHAKMRLYNTPNIVHQDGQQGVIRHVDKVGLLSWLANKYSVPMEYQRGTVRVKAMASELVIFDKTTTTEIARHGLCFEKGKVIQNRNHYRDLNQLVSALEAKIVKQVGTEYGALLCNLLKMSSPKIYKDQLRGVNDLLLHYTTQLDEAAMDWLCKRPRLTATAVKEYLAAYMGKKSQAQGSDIPLAAPTCSTASQLACYSQLLNNGEQNAIH